MPAVCVLDRMPHDEQTGPGLAAFNALPDEDARAALLSCCASTRFAGGVAAMRPFPDRERLLVAAVAAVAALPWPEVLAALRAHPRIGERATGNLKETAWSRGEQSGVAGAGEDVLAGLAAGNLAYEERFGHVYLVCATGLSAEEMLARLRARLRNDEESERRVVRDELAAITRLRVIKLLEEYR